MRIVIMGTGPFAVPSSERLLAEGFDIPLVIVRPPAGNVGKKVVEAPMTTWAKGAGLELFQPASINARESLSRLREVGADLYFVCDYGQILSKDCLAIPKLGGINLHGSLLPRHRGAAPVQWTLLSGDSEAGVSVIHMTPGLDAGPVLSTERVTVGRDENAGELEQRLSAIGAFATLRAVELLRTWDGQTAIGEVQDKAAATKAPRLSRLDGKLDFSLLAKILEQRVRGLQPWPGTFSELVYSSGKRIAIHVRSARALGTSDMPLSQLSEPVATSKAKVEATTLPTSRPIGTAWEISASGLGLAWEAPWNQLLAVQTADGLLLISTVQPAGKKPMPVADFLRGHPILDGAHFE